MRSVRSTVALVQFTKLWTLHPGGLCILFQESTDSTLLTSSFMHQLERSSAHSFLSNDTFRSKLVSRRQRRNEREQHLQQSRWIQISTMTFVNVVGDWESLSAAPRATLSIISSALGQKYPNYLREIGAVPFVSQLELVLITQNHH